MSEQKHGGPAFPCEVDSTQPLHRQVGNTVWQTYGMTLRDYFAAHCDQPGILEVANAAGLVFSANQVWKADGGLIGTFEAWYQKLPQEERCRLTATVRYQFADAMLKARTAS